MIYHDKYYLNLPILQEFAPLTSMLKPDLGQVVAMLIVMVTSYVMDANLK